jgi:hypothetical protein
MLLPKFLRATNLLWIEGSFFQSKETLKEEMKLVNLVQCVAQGSEATMHTID